MRSFRGLGRIIFTWLPGSRSSAFGHCPSPNKKEQAVLFIALMSAVWLFYAMGYCAAAKKKTGCFDLWHSGTAAANFRPAVIEASKKKLPLIVITADRPPELRQTGAVQTIDQVGLFGKYVQWATDMPCPDIKIDPQFVLTTIDQAWYQAVRYHGVVHINCMFRQPLTLVPTSEDFKAYTKSLNRWLQSHKSLTPEYVTGFESVALPIPKKISACLDVIKNGVIVVGKVSDSNEAQLVLHLSEIRLADFFADVSSGLGLDHPNLIHYFDHLLYLKIC